MAKSIEVEGKKMNFPTLFVKHLRNLQYNNVYRKLTYNYKQKHPCFSDIALLWPMCVYVYNDIVNCKKKRERCVEDFLLISEFGDYMCKMQVQDGVFFF